MIESYLPPARACGRPREWSFRDVFDAIFYVLRGGIAWRLLPNDLPPKSTINHEHHIPSDNNADVRYERDPLVGQDEHPRSYLGRKMLLVDVCLLDFLHAAADGYPLHLSAAASL